MKIGDEISECIKTLSKDAKTSEDFLKNVFNLCAKRSTMSAENIYARMEWMLKPSGAQPLALLRNYGQMDEKTLAGHLLSPKKIVFKFIQERNPIPTQTLARIYNAVVASKSPRVEPGHGLPDFTEERALQEMKWWLIDLKFPDYYFTATPPEEIGTQIRVNRFHEMYGTGTKSYESLKISYLSESGQFMYWVHRNKALAAEEEIERLAHLPEQLCDISVYSHGDLLLYLGTRSAPSGSGSSFEAAAPASMSRVLAEEARSRYAKIWRKAIAANGTPLFERSVKEETGERRLMIALPVGYVNHFLSNISRAIASSGVHVTRKYCVTLGGTHPTVISTFYSMDEFPDDLLPKIVSIALYPPGLLARLVEEKTFTPDEVNFINAAAGFIHQFATIGDASVSFLRGKFKESEELQEILGNLQRRIDKDAFAIPDVLESLTARPDLAKELFKAFAGKFAGKAAFDAEALRQAIRQASLQAFDSAVFNAALKFVEDTVNCNFFMPCKQALAFKFRQGFLKGSPYQREPFAVFYIKGRNFTGFHVRFKEIARGGIRLLRPSSEEDKTAYLGNIFEECYNLALTQNRKNKDIPEGGAKGVIALEKPGASTESAHAAFRHYVDALLDLMLVKEPGKEGEALFLGPDEGTAVLMDWATEHAKERGYYLWRGFTTGKCAGLGGISHIDYGMTTHGVREYVKGIYRMTGADEAKTTKVQTGGPDGDLGSNEILLSKEPTLAVVDGGGVLYDPNGLDRGELKRLAEAKLDSSNFDDAKLGKGGFKVRVTDKSIMLPGSNVAVSGAAIRNGFHLDKLFKADIFVPCGGRPKSINSTNWTALMDDNGKPVFKWIVEGANLFITPEARLKLEEHGVILFKDSSTNKGGVTSSSLEVLSGIVLNDAEYGKLMAVAPGQPVPAFRESYIKDIVASIKANARAEFDLLWRLHKETGTPFSDLSDMVSDRINAMADSIEGSDLFENVKLRSHVLLSAMPKTMIDLLGPAKAVRRIPESYQRAIFAKTIARDYVYAHGLDMNFETYRKFINGLGDVKK